MSVSGGDISDNGFNILEYLGIEGSVDVAFVDATGNQLSYAGISNELSKLQKEFQSILTGPTGRCVTVLPDHPTTAILQLSLLGNYPLVLANPANNERELLELIQSVGADTVISRSDNPLIVKMAKENGLLHLGFDLATSQPFASSVSSLSDQRQGFGEVQNAAKKDDAIALVLPTSGSTGVPKLVPLKLSALTKSAQNIVKHLQLSKEDRVLHILPMFHIGAIVDLVLAPLISRGSIYFAHDMAFEQLANNAQQKNISWMQMVPTMLNRLLIETAQPELENLGNSLRFVRSVSSDLPPSMQREIEAKLAGTPIIQIYGMTETAGQITSNPLPPEERKLGSVGLSVGADICIMDAFGNPLGIDEEGEICVSGETLMHGYEGQNNADSFFGPWLRTGDLGRLDKDGYLYISGRLKEIVNRGGEKVALQELDRVALNHPDILEAATFSIPHISLGEEVAIALVTKTASILESELKHYFAEQLAEHKCPRQIFVLQQLPRLGSGKIDRRALKTLVSSEPKQTNIGYRPQSLNERLVSRLWARVLRTKAPVPGDDFFDAGGDSLAATGFLAALEKATKKTFPADLLYKTPSFEKLVEAIDDIAALGKGDYQLDLPKPIFDTVRRATAAWPGRRRAPDSLIIEHNTAGSKQSFFWCGNGLEHFEDMISAFGTDRPVYVLRTLSGMKQKSDINTALLAAHYVLEIEAIQPTGPICLGGFCQGAVLARKVAEQLSDRGREIKIVVFVDRIFVQPFKLPTLMVWSQSSQYSARLEYLNPERGLAYLYPGGAESIRHNSKHRGSVFGQGAIELVRRIEPFLDNGLPKSSFAKSGSKSEHFDDSFSDRAKLYSAELSAKVPRFVSTESEVVLSVEVKNTSEKAWLKSDQGEVFLAARWLNLDGHTRRVMAGFAELEKELEAGESCRLELKIKTPSKKLPYTLMLDMVDDGVSWFHRQGNPAFRKLVFCLK